MVHRIDVTRVTWSAVHRDWFRSLCGFGPIS
jgi:hypothetical protein